MARCLYLFAILEFRQNQGINDQWPQVLLWFEGVEFFYIWPFWWCVNEVLCIPLDEVLSHSEFCYTWRGFEPTTFDEAWRLGLTVRVSYFIFRNQMLFSGSFHTTMIPLYLRYLNVNVTIVGILALHMGYLGVFNLKLDEVLPSFATQEERKIITQSLTSVGFEPATFGPSPECKIPTIVTFEYVYHPRLNSTSS